MNSIKAYQLQGQNRALRQLFEGGGGRAVLTLHRSIRRLRKTQRCKIRKSLELLVETGPRRLCPCLALPAAATGREGAKFGYVTGLLDLGRLTVRQLG